MKNQSFWKKLENNLIQVYSKQEVSLMLKDLQKLIQNSIKKNQKKKKKKISYSDISLITYANSIESDKKKSLPVLNEFLTEFEINKVINIVHLLPFCPWDTDRGFSVRDYYQVDSDYGSWKDVAGLKKTAKLMFDFVANHASIENHLVQNALIERHLSKDDFRYKDYVSYKDFVIAFSDKEKPTEKDLIKLSRPRPNSVLTPYVVFEILNSKSKIELKVILGNVKDIKNSTIFKRSSRDGRGLRKLGSFRILGKGWVWTTFSRPKRKDGTENTRQVDLNYHNPKVFLEAVKILVFYIEKGASLIRLDAVARLWKKLGSSSVHEKETHLLLEAIYDVVFLFSPEVITVAEVNERQDKVFEYLGRKGHQESDLVYQFTHFALVLYSLVNEDGRSYMDWLSTMDRVEGKQFVTVLGSHDGLGIKPLRGVLDEDEIESFAQKLVKKGGLPNYAYLPGGKKIVYEVCSTPWNLINSPKEKEPFSLRLARYKAVLSLGLLIRGLPAIYINGLLGAKNYQPKQGLDENRTVNREIFNKDALFKQLNDKSSHEKRVMREVLGLLKIRTNELSFDPFGKPVKPIFLGNKKIISAFLESKDRKNKLLSLVNISKEPQKVVVGKKAFSSRSEQDVFIGRNLELYDLISKKRLRIAGNKLSLYLKPYQVMWIKNVKCKN